MTLIGFKFICVKCDKVNIVDGLNLIIRDDYYGIDLYICPSCNFRYRIAYFLNSVELSIGAHMLIGIRKLYQW